MWSAEWSKKPLYYMFVRIYKTIARFSPLDFTIGHGGMFTIRQRPLCRYYSTVFYFFIVLHGNATGKLIRFFIKNIASTCIYCCFVSIFCIFDFLYEQYFEYIFGFRPRRRGGGGWGNIGISTIFQLQICIFLINQQVYLLTWLLKANTRPRCRSTFHML